MKQRDIQTYQNKIKAARRYEVVDADSWLSLAGEKLHFIGAGGIGRQ